MARPPFVMVSARFFEERGNTRAGYRAAMVNLWVRLLVGRNRLDGAEGAAEGKLMGADVEPLAIARAVGLVEEMGRKGAEDFVAEGLADAAKHGLLLIEEDSIKIGDWEAWDTSDEDERRRKREREKKRRQRERQRGTPASVPPAVPRGQPDVSPPMSPGDNHGDKGESPVDTSTVPQGHDPDRVDPEDPLDPQTQEPTPTPPSGIGMEEKRRIAAMVQPEDPKPSWRMSEKWWVELRAKAMLPHFAQFVGFIRSYGQLVVDQRLVRSAAPFQRVCSPMGIRTLGKLRIRLDEDYDGDWETFRADLWTAAKGLVNDTNARKGGYIEPDKHLLRDTAQFERHRRAGERLKQARDTTTGKAHSGGNIQGNWSQEGQPMQWKNT